MRIQILTLPMVSLGEHTEEPFALVVDQCESGLLNPRDDVAWKRFADEVGARAVLVVPYTVEIVDRYAEPQPMTVSFDASAIKDADAEKIAAHVTSEIERLRNKGLWDV